MPKSSIKAEVKTFVQGLITEASPLNFPPNASMEEENFVLKADGTRERRLGLNLEDDFSYRSINFPSPVYLTTKMKTFEWNNAGGISGLTYIGVYDYDHIKFFRATGNLSTYGYAGAVSIAAMGSVGNEHSFAAVNGKLMMVGGVGNIGIIDTDGTTFTFTTKRLLTRDVWGVYTGPSTEQLKVENDPTYRPASRVSDNYHYNLHNQGWGIPRTSDVIAVVADPISEIAIHSGQYPSYSDSIWTVMQFQAKNGTVPPHERIFTNLFKETTGVTGDIAKGYFIIDVLDRGGSRSAAVLSNQAKYPELLDLETYSAPFDITTGGSTVICEFAGRVFYAGFNGRTTGGDIRSPVLNSYVFFSQLVKSAPDVIKCYQEGDPTSREANDIVDTDGGFIRIAGCGQIHRMFSTGDSLLVLADNGVWAVSGGADYGFTATNYKVDKIASFGCNSPDSVIEDSGNVFYWSPDGIYAVSRNQIGKLVAESISKTTIQTYYDKFSNDAKKYCKGYSDTKGRKLRWLVTEGDYVSTVTKQTEIVFDTILKAFSLNTFSSSTNYITGMTRTYPDLDMKYVVGFASGTLKYLGFAYYRDKSFKDWSSTPNGPVDYKSFLLTGAITGEDSSVAKQVPYLTMHFIRTEDSTDSVGTPLMQSSCLVRSQWDWTNTAAANKWGPLRQAYRYVRAFYPETTGAGYDTGYSLITTKNKLRGRGKAFSMYLESESGKDCKIVGWNININGNAQT